MLRFSRAMRRLARLNAGQAFRSSGWVTDTSNVGE